MSTLRVLIVEDDLDTARSLAALVQSWGHTVISAQSGRRATAVAPEFQPQVVLLDLSLVREHGYVVAADLRAQAGERTLYFVAITAWTQPADEARSKLHGIHHHLPKPINPDVLREILIAYTICENPHLVSAAPLP